MSNVIDNVRKELLQRSDAKIRDSGFRFFKEEVKLHGVKTAVVKNIAKQHFKLIKNESKAEIFQLCDKLWQSGYMEETFVACEWSYSLRKSFEPTDFIVFEKWVNTYVNNWASCDTFCNHTVGTFVDMYPEYINDLKKWAKSDSRWPRRAAAVSLIIPARRGKFLKEILEIADILLMDKEDLVQKGYGWMLKAASEKHQRPVFDYVMKRKSVMPRTALRYAIEKMPLELRKEAMEKPLKI